MKSLSHEEDIQKIALISKICSEYHKLEHNGTLEKIKDAINIPEAQDLDDQ